MNKTELVIAVSKELELPLRKSEEIVNLVFETMSGALIKDDRIEIRGFGSFEVREYKDYTGRNPRTGEKVAVNGKKLPFFKRDIVDDGPTNTQTSLYEG
ncbi:MAG TPA: HU family DNA-binding protein [Desulfomonilaceae bacterium]|nr:HU family DNA-binding protein [Desulfomonilaceae bacterium]